MSAGWINGNTSEKRDLFLYHATKAFSKTGFRKTEVKVIAEACGVGKATIYKEFGNKDGIIIAIITDILDHLKEISLKNLIGGGTPGERFEVVVMELLQFIEDRRELMKVLFIECEEFLEQINEYYFDILDRNLPLAEKFFDAARAQGELRAMPVRDIIMMMVNLVIGTAYSWVVHGQGSLVEQCMSYIRVMVLGLSHEPAELENRLEFLSAS